MSSLSSTNICTVPWTHYTLTQNTIKTCCWGGAKYSFCFEDYEGPWQNDMWLVNPAFIKQRTSMLESGMTGTCPNICPRKNNTPSVEEQLRKLAINEDCLEICNLIAHQIQNDIADEAIPPLYLGISPGFKCNQECIFCCVDRERLCLKRKNPTVQEFKNLLPLYEKCIDFRTVGGDTFAQTDEILEIMYGPIWNRPHMNTGVITNGAGLTLERYERFCIEGPINNIFISVDSLIPETYRILHQRPIEPMMRNLMEITTKYPEHYISKISMVVTTINIHEIPELMKFAIDRNINTTYFRLVIPNHLPKRNASYLYPYSPSEGKKMYETYLQIKGEVKRLEQEYGVPAICFDHLGDRLRVLAKEC